MSDTDTVSVGDRQLADLADSRFDPPESDMLAPGDSAEEEPETGPGAAITHLSVARQRRDTSDNSETGAKSGPPTLDEWERLFSKFLVRAATEWYLDWAFRGIDENELSQREIERLALTDEERTRICVPFAELSNKSKFMRKHGRLIVSSAESVDSVLTLGIWFNRVNRIRAKHLPPTGQVKQPRQQRRGEQNVSAGQSPSSPDASSNGHIREGIVIVPGDGG
jgi:hypothetical protein